VKEEEETGEEKVEKKGRSICEETLKTSHGKA
jgi:hypothetical protein